ncbi:ABC transporter ATP-binding protein [Faecalicatena sp. Marseille-Q4148]|nr:ABC transporter ATP-binding protein [Faecalicatena sp. Marseille-Q4148]
MFEKYKFHKTGFYLLKVLHHLDHQAILISTGSSLLEIFSFYFGLFYSARIIDDLLRQEWRSAVLHSGILILSELFFGLVQNQLTKSMSVKYQMLYTDLKILMRKKALSMRFESFENPEVIRKIYLAERTIDMYGGVEQVLYLYQQLIVSALSIVTAVGMVVHMCFLKGKMGSAGVWFSVISFGMMFWSIVKLTTVSNQRLSERQSQIYSEHGDAEQGLSYYMDNIYGNPEANKVCHIYQMNDMIEKNFSRFLETSSDLYKRMRTVRRKQELAGQGIGMLFTVYSYALILIKIAGNAITIGSFSKYAGATTRFMTDVTMLIWINGEIERKCEMMRGLVEFMEMKEERREGKLSVPKQNVKDYEFEFHHVSFRYPGNETEILKGIDCKLSADSRTAIVGRNGAGKTTFIKLLCGLYEPTEGYITLNGIDIREYDYQEYLKLFGVVFQDFAMFAFSIGQNIAVAQEYDEQKVWKCLREIGVERIVNELPEKLETPMFAESEDGVNFSGGEKQKLAIVRALYQDAMIMILDEPTAALDPISEYEIYQNFDTLAEDKMSVFITHRMSSCRFCDDIIVFDSGTIAERGTHEQLLQNGRLYSELWKAQAQYYHN